MLKQVILIIATIGYAQTGLAAAEVCDMEPKAKKDIVAEEICMELAYTRRMDVRDRYEIARSHGFGPAGREYLADAENIESCNLLSGFVITMACLSDSSRESLKEAASKTEN